jgi:hypothetical protein
MANRVPIRAALQRIGFSAAAATNLTDTQGMDNLDEFYLLDDTEITNLCKTVRRPGGLLANNVPDPGHAITPRAETNLKLAVYFVRYQIRTSRTVQAADITLLSIRALKDHRQWETDHKDVEAPTINVKDWPKTIEGLEEYLRGCLGVTKIPLAYVVRADIQVPAAGADPVYTSRQDELITRAPIVIQGPGGVEAHTATYLSDRTKVWELISEICRGNDCFSYIRPAQRTRDGRQAFYGLKGHYLGVNNVDNMSGLAEKQLASSTYHGEQRRWDFEKYTRIHVDQHAILSGLVQYGYAGIDERSKVRHLLHGIKTNKLDTVKSTIMADASLRNDFDRCVNLFKDFIVQSGMQQNVRDSEISAITHEKSKHNNGGNFNKQVTPDMSVEDRYYKRSEYMSLSAAQKLGLKRKRDGRGHKPGMKSKSNNGKNVKFDLSRRSIKAIATQLSKTKQHDNETDSSTTDEEQHTSKKAKKDTNNRTNAALNRAQN